MPATDRRNKRNTKPPEPPVIEVKPPEAPPSEPSEPLVIERTTTDVKLPEKGGRPRPTVRVVKTVRHNDPPPRQPRGPNRRIIG